MNYIHPTAIIGPNVVMGDNNYIGPYCIIGYPAEHKEYWKMENVIPEGMREWVPERLEPVSGKVIIGNNNKFTGHVTIDAGTTGATVIADNVWMLKHSHVGHDAIIASDVVISCGAKIGGHCVIGGGNNIGLNAVLHQRTEVPPMCMIGMGAVITKKTELLPGMKYAGNPARCLGVNKKP